MPMNADDSFAGFSAGGTDIFVISAITQTMIGEWLMKHTRRYVGGGISENKHKRFFWVHPYTKTLYWSPTEPGVDGSEAKAKSAFIESVTAVPSNQPASPMSLLIRTPKRDLKLTAPTLERHELWFKSINFLIGRPNNHHNQLPEEPRSTHDSYESGDPQFKQTTESINQYDSEDSEENINIRQCCDDLFHIHLY
ncbi:meiotic cell cortex C-terminal pleckstrin homology-domain-containing protein [Pilobolus umbonatus]|nr:meiotic cell cortex C-terminal pleckstrin homology-domain-containing protein [Pilobolus umbonatus]